MALTVHTSLKLHVHKISLLALFFLRSPLQAEGLVVNITEQDMPALKDEVVAISELIVSHRKHLDRQLQLKEQMVQFQMQKDELLRGNLTQKHARAMVINATEILLGINQEHIAYLFSREYLEELQFFSAVVGKNRPVRP
ncbi:MAG: hypothetical protein WCG14_02190 [Chlamydiia bacterium]